MSKTKKLWFGLPKGSLQEATIAKLAKAGWNVRVSSRSYLPFVDDDELDIRTIRAQEMRIPWRGRAAPPLQQHPERKTWEC